MANLLAGADWAAAVADLGDTPGQRRCEVPLSPAVGPVCITGITGFIALHLARQLLEKGYSVVGTVRSESNAEKMAPVAALQERFGERLRVVAGVDCLKPETFEAAVADCVGVFHTASPFHFKSEDPINDLVMPAKVGTESCLAACKAVGTVKRVIVTSSFAAIFNPGVYPPDYTYSSKDWNKTSCPGADGQFPAPAPAHGYRYSKTVAEKAAWDFAAADDCPFDVACINPPMVIGENMNRPSSVDDLNTSSGMVLKILRGELDTQPNSMAWVDVADVARAHIAAYEHAEAGGRRFLCAADEVPFWTEAHRMLAECGPNCPVKLEPPAAGEGQRMGLDTSALKSLDFAFTPLLESFRAQAQSLLDLGFLPQL